MILSYRLLLPRVTLHQRRALQCVLAITALLLLCAPSCTVSGQERLVLGYYPYWNRATYPPASIPLEHLTHISHAFVWPEPSGALHVPADFIHPELLQAAQNRRVHVLLAVGGWGYSAAFGQVVADPSKRRRFVEALVAFASTHGYDGIDLDWEFPSRNDRAGLIALVRELEQGLHRQDPALTLSLTLPAHDAEDAYDVDALAPHLDWFSAMTYDYHGDWSDHSGHNAPLFAPEHLDGSVDSSVRFWVQRGVPHQALAIGLPFYGRSFESGDLNGPSASSRAVTYAEVQDVSAGWTRQWDSSAHVPYVQNPARTVLISYDDSLSVRLKVGYVLQHDLKGVILWSLGQDMLLSGTQPLLETAATYLRGPNSHPAPR